MLETASVKRKRATEEFEVIDVVVNDGGQNPILPIKRSLSAHTSDVSVIAPTVIDASEEENEEEFDAALSPVGVAGSTAGSAAANIVCSMAGSAAANCPMDLTQTWAGASGLEYTEEELRYSLNGCSDADAAETEDDEEDQKHFKCKVYNSSPHSSAATTLQNHHP